MIIGKIGKFETTKEGKKISIYLSSGAAEAMVLQDAGSEVEILERKYKGETEQRPPQVNTLDNVYQGLAMISEIVAELIMKEKNKPKPEKEDLP